MRTLFVHPSALLYSEIFLRLEPLGVERCAAAARAAGHQVDVIDLQVSSWADFDRLLEQFAPEAVAFSVNYLANVPEVIELAARAKRRRPGVFVFAGGHSVSFIARHLLEQADGALDAVVRGEGEVGVVQLLEAVPDGAIASVPGVVSPAGTGPAPLLLDSLDEPLPARDLMRHRRKYFIGVLDPCASVEFTRGCPWDCSFCSAWTFYGRSYRKLSPAAAGVELATIKEPNVFIVDDVAFIRPEHGDSIAAELEKRRIEKRYYLETRADVLLRNTEVFERWRRLGLEYMFLGMESLDREGLDLFRKRISPDDNFKALEVARRIGITVAINLIVDPDWDREQFRLVREFAQSVPEIVHLTVKTPYPGTEIWHTEARKLTSRDYRLFDIQHAVLPTRLSLEEFYRELVRTQGVLARKHLGVSAVVQTFGIMSRQLLRGQTNFARMIWKFNKVYNADRQLHDHAAPVRYELPVPEHHEVAPRDRAALYIHPRPPRAAAPGAEPGRAGAEVAGG
jgi:hopanoid C-3 methylase HpnR